MKMKMDKDLVYMGAGAGAGIFIPIALIKYADPTGNPIPQFGNWGNWSVLVPLLTGAGAMYLAFMTKKIKDKKANTFMKAYSVTALITGLANGIFGLQTSAGLRATYAPRARSAYTQARARGFGSYYASPATTIPYNTINY